MLNQLNFIILADKGSRVVVYLGTNRDNCFLEQYELDLSYRLKELTILLFKVLNNLLFSQDALIMFLNGFLVICTFSQFFLMLDTPFQLLNLLHVFSDLASSLGLNCLLSLTNVFGSERKHDARVVG